MLYYNIKFTYIGVHMHSEHRKRLKGRFLREGLEHFEPHNVLELLLFYSIPQKDTNETAHLLMQRFGSLQGVFDAPFEELCRVPGIKEHSATLIKLIPSLARLYAAGETTEKTTLKTKEDIGAYLAARYVGITSEVVYMLLLDNKFSVIDFIRVHEGSVNSSAITIRRLVELAMLKDASMVVVAHNHPSGMAFPSSDDLHTTLLLRNAFRTVEIPLVGHYIIAGNKYFDILDAINEGEPK